MVYFGLLGHGSSFTLLSETTARTIMGRTTPAAMTSTAGLYIFCHDFSRRTMGTWRTTHYLKSVSSIGRKRIKSTAPFIGVARAVRANGIINLASVIFYSIITITEIIEFAPF
ncbi:hypothetical protein [Burkholderia ubonensis]|uniref:hypothetical protein n=1 Tax=Burkholderia ubonensis TaxID=101571 RepID=UPI0012FA9C34|nr:hypothetical protein [Burkholderia ubonensis]